MLLSQDWSSCGFWLPRPRHLRHRAWRESILQIPLFLTCKSRLTTMTGRSKSYKAGTRRCINRQVQYRDRSLDAHPASNDLPTCGPVLLGSLHSTNESTRLRAEYAGASACGGILAEGEMRRLQNQSDVAWAAVKRIRCRNRQMAV